MEFRLGLEKRLHLLRHLEQQLVRIRPCPLRLGHSLLALRLILQALCQGGPRRVEIAGRDLKLRSRGAAGRYVMPLPRLALCRSRQRFWRSALLSAMAAPVT